MGIQEKEIVELFREMQKEASPSYIASKPPIKQEVVGILTAARIMKRVLEKCTLEVCLSVDQLQDKINSSDFTLTLQQANAIIDMDDIGCFGEGLYPETEEARQGWSQLLAQAEAITGQTARKNLTDVQIEAQEIADEACKVAYQKSLAEEAHARRNSGNLTPPWGGRMV